MRDSSSVLPSKRSPLTPAAMPPVHLEAFEGPLDLLLHLIRINEIDIYDIPIAEITQQYLQVIAAMEALDLTIAGEYLVMAATLIEIKSRMLLPQAPIQADAPEMEEDPRAELVQRLLDYQQFRETIATLQRWEEERRRIYFRDAVQNVEDYLLPVPQGEVTPAQLHHALHQMLARAGLEEKPLTTVVPRRRLSLRLKMVEIMRKLEAIAPETVPFESLFVLPGPVYDIVLTFLAILELLRLGRVRVEQAEPFAPIYLYASGGASAT
ncbi:segregation and condensation protein A [Chthonomonas calidirosea]|uniref:segregation and condensation protein A n=1 Tax=Chthonomonas calidirosea TaxID=454171 RepID=UPI0009EA5972|nr:segregation/condensation protein A [Chthonomonas calidirosea]